MGDNDMKQCPYCAESIRNDAVKCRYCGSMFNTASGSATPPTGTRHWNRSVTDKRFAGVCGGIAREFNAPHMILPLRLFFILATIFWGFGIVLYVILWALMPSEAGAGAAYSAPQPGETAPTAQPYTTSGNHRNNTAALIVLALVCLAVIAVFSRYFYFGQPFMPHISIPHVHLPFNNWDHSFAIGNFGGFPHFLRFPLSVGLIIVVMTILLFGAFHMFRVALGCLGILIALIAMLIVLPLLIPIVVIPVAVLLPLILFFGFIALIVMALKALLG